VDLQKAIRELQAEKKRIDGVIASLEQMLTPGRTPGAPKAVATKRRKRMTAAQRKAISDRMAKYWAAKRLSAS
jgi:hypothetical protein